MFEFDAGKFVIIGIVALIVIGPKELPRVMRQLGQIVAKLRRLSGEFQAQFMEAMREADLDELKAEAAKISEAARLDQSIDPLAGIRAELTKSLEEPGTPPVEPALATQSDPLVDAVQEDPQAALRIIEQREAAPEPLPVAAATIGAEVPPEGAVPDAGAPVIVSDSIAPDRPSAELPSPAADVMPLRKRG